MNINKEKYLAFKKIHEDFSNILKNDRCRTCACFYLDILAPVVEAIRVFRENENEKKLLSVEKDFKRWLKEGTEFNLHE